jgi:hypothetical protein
LITGAGCLVPIQPTTRAKSFAIWLTKRPGWQGQEHLFPEHVFKRKATVLIIPDFCLGRGDRVLCAEGIYTGRTEKQVEFAGKVVLDRFDAAGTGNFEVSVEAAFEANVGDDFLGAAMLVEHLGPAFGGQIA